jgi:signal transduction histidine kinase
MKKWFVALLLFIPNCSSAQKIDSLLVSLKKMPADTQRVNSFYDLSYAYWVGGDDSLATAYSLQSVSLAKKLKFVQGEMKARLLLARIELDRFSDLATAYAHLDTVHIMARRIGDKKNEGMVYFRRAQFFKELLEKQSRVNPLLDSALALFVEIGDKSAQGFVYGEMAQSLGLQGKYADAVAMTLRARKLQEEVNDLAALRSTVTNLGVYYYSLGLYNEALQTFNEAEVIARKRNDNVLMAFLYNQRGEIFDRQGKNREALEQLEKAVKIHEASKAPFWLARTYARMGSVYLKAGDFVNGMRYTKLADKVYSEMVDSKESLDHYVQLNYGKIFLSQKAYSKVIRYATKGLEWAMEAEPPLLKESSEYHRLLSAAYEGLGKKAQALEHFKIYKTQSDSLLNKESVQKVTVATMTYTFDKKQQVDKLTIETLKNEKLIQFRNFLIGLSLLGFIITIFILWSNRRLRRKNAELVAKNREIEEALFRGQKLERKRVASELHDNLNTKLAALRWRLEAMNMGQYALGDQKIHEGSLEMLNDIYDDVRLISHSMLPVELETLGLISALRKLTDSLNINSRTRFHLVINEAGVRPPAVVEHELYIMTLELVNNVLKHAQASEVWISVSQDHKSVRLTVSDNGVGLNEDLKSDGMGMFNLQNRVEALRGKLTIESGVGTGLKVGVEVELGD